MSNANVFPFPGFNIPGFPVPGNPDPGVNPQPPAFPALPSASPVVTDRETRLRMIAMALSVEDALFAADLAELTSEGKKRKLMRIGVGAVGGLVVGVVVAKLAAR